MKLLCFFFYFFCYSLITAAQDTTILIQLTFPIESAYDDMEELGNGEMLANSTDIELAQDPDNGGAQTIGLHFNNIQIGQGANIEQASIQFRTDEVSSGNCTINIQAENIDDATSFTANSFDITNRPLSNEAVSWSPPSWWTSQQVSSSQRTPDLSAIIQKIVDRPNWEPGNAINLIMNGSGRRVAHAYESNPAYAANLHIDVSVPVLKDDLSNIYINELMAKNNVVTDEYDEKDDWVELYNANDTSVLLTGVYLSDDADDKTKWQIEGPLLIPPHGFIVLWLDDQAGQGDLHAPFKLSSSGESLFLSQQQGSELVVIDEVTFGALPENISYGRETDGNNNWVYFGEYSPQQSNNDNGLYFNATLSFSSYGGFYESTIELGISCSDPSAQIRMTTDGSLPTENSLLYTNPINISQTTLLRAAAFKPGYASGPKKEEFYLINGNHELPVIQLSIEPKYLWDNQEGMYITGTNGIPGYCSDIPRNWNQDWERPVSIRYFEPDGEEAFRINAGVKIGGACSRGFSMKMFNFFIRGDEYGDNEIIYPLFKDLGIEEFKRFKLRASGNDFSLTMVRDASIQSLLYNQADIDLMAYEPVVVYLNGEYWGFYGVREHFNKHYIESHHGVDKDNLDLIKNPYTDAEVKEGNTIAWNALTNYIRNNSLGNQEKMDYVATQMDVNEFMNYNIVQVYIANYDWPANNVGVWRDRNNGKWRWMLFDTDISSGYGQWSPSVASFNAINHATTLNGNSWPNGEASTLYLRTLLDNQKFEDEFAQRTCTFAQVIFAPERTDHFIDSLANRIASEVPALFSKFNNSPASWLLWFDNPLGGSYSSWQNHLYTFRNFFDIRFDYVLAHYKNHFGYNGHFNLKINYDANTNGSVVLHTNEMAIPYQYEGKYFNNTPIVIKAIPDLGYHFAHWEETGDTIATIHFKANSNSVLTPIFVKDGEEDPPPPPPPAVDPDPESVFQVFPVPASTELTLKYSELKTTRFSVRIYNVIGQMVYSKELTAGPFIQEHSIDVSDWAGGVYFFETMIGDKEILEKLVVD